MPADLGPLINEIASQAEDFLAGVRDRPLACAAIGEFLTLEYPFLIPEDRVLVTQAVIGVLEENDFFGIEFVGDPFSEIEPSDDL